MTVRAILRECASDLLDTEPNVTVDQVVGCAYRRHADEFQQASQQMVMAAARDIVAKLMRDLADDDGPSQLSLPGLGLPSAIAVQHPNGTYYVRSDKATWDELLAGRTLRESNVSAAQAKLDAYDESLDLLRSYMEGTSLTVAEAARQIASAA